MNLGNRVVSRFLKRLGRMVMMPLAPIQPTSKKSHLHAPASQEIALQTRHIQSRVLNIGSVLRLFAALLLMGTASTAMAGAWSCGPASAGGDFQLLDGADPSTWPAGFTNTSISSLSFVGDCTIKNFPQSMGGGFGTGSTLLNFNLPGKSAVIVMDNVYYTGNMSCSNLPPGVVIWWVNGSWNSINAKCQAFIPPLDGLHKLNPAGQTTESIGIPFTYTLTMPEKVILNSDGSYTWTGLADPAVVSAVDIYDDLTTTGADLTYLSNAAYLKSSTGVLTPIGALTNLGDSKHLHFQYSNIPANTQLVIELTVVLDSTAANTPGKQFANTASWTLTKVVTNADGSTTTIAGVPGMDGVTDPMTIAEPNLVLTKSSPSTTINLGVATNFTLNVQNTGGSTAYNTTITDNLPAGMCTYDPQPSLTAQIFAADGVTPVSPVLVNNTDYQVTWNGGTAAACQLTVTMKDTAAAKIGPTQRLKINYQAEIDSTGVTSGSTLTNVAGATQWYNGDSSQATRLAYNKVITDGTPGTQDFQDAYTVTAALAGYYFQKTVQDLTTGASTYSTTSPLTVFPGDRLRYTLTLQNFTWPTLSNINITDDLGAFNGNGVIVPGSLSINWSGTTIPSANITVNSSGGTNGAGLISINNLTLQSDQQYQIQFDVTLGSTLTSGTSVYNQANLLKWATDTNGTQWRGPSDDPYINGTVLLGAGGEDKTRVVVQAPGALLKQNPSPASATIGQQFSYRITVPSSPATVPLYDVQILDTLPANVSYVSAQVVSGGTWSLSNTGSGNNLIIQDSATGIDIPAGGQAVIEVTVALNNTTTNSKGVTFTNSASYKYNKINGDFTTQADGTGNTTPNMTVVEPSLTASKTVANLTSGKATAAIGDTLQYTVTIPNGGTSTAFDTSVVDALPTNVVLVAGSATASINGTPVAGFIATPTLLPSGALAWGNQNNDGTLDIPAGQSLVLSYQVTVLAVNGTPISNNVYADWSSLNGTNPGERTGAGCPTTSSPNTYCTGPATASIITNDPTTITKAFVSDSWDTGLSTASDAKLRIGDTVDYTLRLNLREGLTQNVVVTDTLPAGLAFDSVVSINGDTTVPFSASAPFTYNDFTAPAVSGNTVTWGLGDISNAVDNNPANDTFVIVYRARVVKDTLSQAATTSLTNNVALTYTGAAAPLTSSATISALQPVMSTPTKTATGFASPANVNITSDVMPFHLQSCNNGQAPAYSAKFTDVLAPEMDETSLSTPVVGIGPSGSPTTLTAPGDYTYTYDGTTRTMTFVFNTPVNPSQCVSIDYTIGFHNNIAPNSTWSNSVSLDEYWSLTDQSVGQKYGPLTSQPFVMTNPVTLPPVAKVITSPTTGQATIGEAVVYTITVPSTAINAELDNVTVSDDLDPALAYTVGTATASDGVNPVALTDNSSAPGTVRLLIPRIPAGQQVTITLPTRVANIATAQAGYSFTNTASYTYPTIPAGTNTSATTGPLTIVEPLIAITKSANPNSGAIAGDTLTYTVTLTNNGNSTAYDTSLVDTLGLGLKYKSGTTTIVGAPSVEPTLNTGDGVSTQQTLTWSGIVIAPGATITVQYQVDVLGSVTAGQVLSNNATTTWSSLSGPSPYERDGSGTPSVNNYFASATTSQTVGDKTTLAKVWNSDTFSGGAVPADVRIGDLVEYKVSLGLQEGTTPGVTLTDQLPPGLAYDSLVSITPTSGSSNFTYTINSQPSKDQTGTVTWDLGTVVNTPDGNPSNDTLVIIYRARVLNNVLAQTPTTLTRNNLATLTYNTTGSLTATAPIYVIQPNLSVSKSVATAGGGTVINAGETVTYTVDITNNGAAPAYDAVLNDTLPVGMRQTGGPTTVSVSLVNAGTVLPNLTPTYTASTGAASWNFDNGTADTYTIPAGDTLRIVYQVKADSTLGAGVTMTNSAVVPLYYSFDNNAIPSGSVANRQVYGPTNTATTTLTSTLPGALLKENTQATAAIGEQFKYRITVPATPVATALHDVRILDDLSTSAANLTFVSVAKVSGSVSWTPVNTGTSTNLVIEDTTNGIDIPAGEQVVVEVTVELMNTAQNVSGLTFTNTANYTYDTLDNTPASQMTGQPGTTAPMTIIGPDTLTLQKSGPATMRLGMPGTFTLNVQNTGSARAWDVTITDQLPNPTPGGMCSVAPTITSAQVFQADGTTPVSAVLVAGTDYSVNFVAGASNCSFTFTGLTAAAAIDPTQRLIITYQASLDADNPPNITLTNIAAATQWFSQDTSGTGATGQTHTYTGPLTDGTVGTLDNQDAFSVTTEAPVLQVQKTVQDVTSGLNPASSAKPGDRLRYTITINNISPVDVPNFSLIDDLGALNPGTVFVPGSLSIISAPSGGTITNASSPSGGTNSAGLVSLSGLSLGAQGSTTASMTIVFEATLAPVISNGTVVLNQGHLNAYGNLLANTDDPNVNGIDNPNVLGDEDPTRTVIASAPLMQVQKTSQDLTGDPNVLLPGDTLRYTITVKNIGSENATGVSLSDVVPNFTTYVAGTTRLNGAVVTDPSAGVSALQNGMLIHSPANSTAGAMPADATSATNNVATITFDVTVNSNVVSGTIISNQGYVIGSGAGSGPFPATPSDDPNTTAVNDPTRNIVGNVPMLQSTKTVSFVDNNGNGLVDAGDTLHYIITVNNLGTVTATGVTLTDTGTEIIPVGSSSPSPGGTAYVTGTTLLNGTAVSDVGAGTSALVSGMLINAAGSTSGTIPAGGNAVVAFDVTVNTGVNPGDTISNQGFVTSAELTTSVPTDADGDPANGYQPTTITVGTAQQLSIVKDVVDLNGGVVQPGDTLEYVVTVTNSGTVAATNVVISDDLSQSPLSGQVSYVTGSANLDASTAGVSYTSSVVTANYSATYGALQPNATTTLRFRVVVNGSLPTGTTITNTAQVAWNTAPTMTLSSSASVDVGAIPGSAILSGRAWHDVDFNNSYLSTTDHQMSGWSVELYQSGSRIASTTTDANGFYSFSGLAPTTTSADQYEVRFSTPGAGASTASLGNGYSATRFTDGPQRISNISATSGSNIQNLDLPLQPNGVVYDSLRRTPIAGATLTMTSAGSTAPLPSSCFLDPAQQGQVTLASGFYKFDLKVGDPACPAGDYVIRVTPPAGYTGGVSQIIRPGTAPYSVATCAAPSTQTSSGYCEAQPSEFAPQGSTTSYYLNLTLSTPVPTSSQLFNNHIPLDPSTQSILGITKTSALVNVSRGQLVPYTITVTNSTNVTLTAMQIVDSFPAGFKYVAGSSRVNGVPVEPVITNQTLTWNNQQINSGTTPYTIKLLFIVGSGVGEGKYVNRARALNALTGDSTADAAATVRVVPDPTFDCTDVIGKVFDDANRNGYQDKGEKGLPGVRVVSARGLIITTDAHGRFHITCAVTPDADRGSNYILKVDERTLPTGYRITTENPRVQRATRGKMLKFNFGATIHRVIRIDMANGVFEPGSTAIRTQWRPRLGLLLEELKKGPSILRVAYMAEVEDEGLVDRRLKAVKEAIAKLWSEQHGDYELTIETEVFWRTGAPPEKGRQ